MGKIYTAMGLMSGTSLDGVDVSIIESDGKSEYSSILDRYYEYDDNLIQKIHEIHIEHAEQYNKQFEKRKEKNERT